MPDGIPLIRVTAMPSDTNPYGGVFGGWLMGQMGLACGSFASKHSKGKAILELDPANDRLCVKLRVEGIDGSFLGHVFDLRCTWPPARPKNIPAAGSPAGLSSRNWASIMSARSTATMSKRWSRSWRMSATPMKGP